MDNLIEIELAKASEKTGLPREELLKLVGKEFGKGVLPRFIKLANIP